MKPLAFVFPGQGSQSVGMMNDWGDHQSLVSNVFSEASEALGYDPQELVTSGPAEKLNQTEITQPAMLTAGVASYRVWQSLNLPQPMCFAGHSLGEYTALVCADSMNFGDAVKLVSERGRLMQSAVAPGEGAMAAIIGLADEKVEQACADVNEGVVAAVNYNSPGQVVIAGNAASVEQAMANAKELGAKRALPLPVSVPSHCDLMRDAADALYSQLENVEISMPSAPVIHNQNASAAESVDDIRNLLKLQLFQPVRWVDCVKNIQYINAETFIEFGPGKVLSGLIKRIDKSLNALPVFDLDTLNKSQQNLSENS